MRKSLHRILWIKLYLIISVISLTVLFSCLYLLSTVNVRDNATYTFEIKSGDSLYKITTNLSNDNILYCPRLLRIFIHFFGLDNNIQTGEYEITNKTRVYDLIKKISSGDVKRYKTIILEGETFRALLEKFKSAQNLSFNYELLANEKEYINKLQDLLLKNNSNNFIFSFAAQDKIVSLEGLLFPDTYFYIKGDSELDIIIRSFIKLDNLIKSLWDARDIRIDQYIKNPYQALIVASILEKEAADNSERLLVSGVLYNRLEKNMPLQVDPTVIYGLGGKYSGSLSKQDLSINNAYNTYVNKGLPPTPISFVSIDSIKAALNPSKHELLYFVSMGNGKHFFSADLETHNQAVQTYQKQKKEAEQVNTQNK